MLTSLITGHWALHYYYYYSLTLIGVIGLIQQMLGVKMQVWQSAALRHNFQKS